MVILFPKGIFSYSPVKAKTGYESIIDGFNRNTASMFANEPEESFIHPTKKPNDTWLVSTNEVVSAEDENTAHDYVRRFAEKLNEKKDIDNLCAQDDLWKIFFGESKEEAEPKKNEPESIFDHIEDFFPTKTEDDANSVPKMKEQKNPFVFIANRLTFLIKTKQPVIFNTSMIESHDNYMDIAIDEEKTFPKLHNVNDVGRITTELNKDEELLSEIKEYLDGTGWKNIFCFPVVMNQRMENETLAIRFVVTK